MYIYIYIYIYDIFCDISPDKSYIHAILFWGAVEGGSEGAGGIGTRGSAFGLRKRGLGVLPESGAHQAVANSPSQMDHGVSSRVALSAPSNPESKSSRVKRAKTDSPYGAFTVGHYQPPELRWAPLGVLGNAPAGLEGGGH